MSYSEYKKYKAVGEWWTNAGRGKFPIQVPHAITQLQKKEGISFHEAFERLVRSGSIVFVDKGIKMTNHMNKKTVKKSSGAIIESCDKLLEGFFSETLKKQKGLDKQIVQILEQLYKEGHLTADNITKALAEEREKISNHE